MHEEVVSSSPGDHPNESAENAETRHSAERLGSESADVDNDVVSHPTGLSWKDAVRYVLKVSGGPMSTTAISDRISEWNLRSSQISNPVQAVNNALRIQLKAEVEQDQDSKYRLTDEAAAAVRLEEFYNTPSTNTAIAEDAEVSREIAKENSERIIRSFGIFWSRSDVIWKASQGSSRTATRMLGRSNDRAPEIDFGDQPGIYILYNGEKPIYVGQAKDGRLSDRIGDHTRDRLKSRWDRFSWFGLKSVDPNASRLEPLLGYESDPTVMVKQLIDAFEALLIEGMEPAQNRRGGNQLKDIEYLQVRDPNLDQFQDQAEAFARFMRLVID